MKHAIPIILSLVFLGALSAQAQGGAAPEANSPNAVAAPARPVAGVPAPAASPGRQRILDLLQSIRLNEVGYHLPLPEVLRLLHEESRKRDPDHKGINFLLNPNGDTATGGMVPRNNTGAAAVTSAAPAPNFAQITVRIVPPLTNVSMAEVLEAIVKAADSPIRYSVKDYAVVFCPRPRESSKN